MTTNAPPLPGVPEPVGRGDGLWSPGWGKAEAAYWRTYCRNAGDCRYCGQPKGHHDSDCKTLQTEDEK